MKAGLTVAIAAVLAVVIYLIASSTSSGPRYRLQVCMYFGGRFNCKTVSARSEKAALQSAIQNACADITSGVTEVMNCEGSQPRSVKWLERPGASAK